MTEKELKKLSRKHLLELLLKQTERVEQLQKQLADTEARLNDRALVESEAGSIAEASLKLNGVFEAAESAAEQYLENIRKLSEDQDRVRIAAENEARRKADAIIADAERRCAEREAESENRLEEISAQIQQLYRQKELLDDIFRSISVK
ncbi:MAG: hypothetical protein IJP27_05645 [Clostridia bacterium]|nr:hypothetical protein [Clostridia bacterium]